MPSFHCTLCKSYPKKYQTATVERNKPSINGCQSRVVTSASHKVLAHQFLTHINSFVACWALSRHIGVSCFQNQTDLRCWTKKSKDRLTFLFSVNTCLQEGEGRFQYMDMCINWACAIGHGETLQGSVLNERHLLPRSSPVFFFLKNSINIVRDWYRFHLGLTTLPGKLKKHNSFVSPFTEQICSIE